MGVLKAKVGGSWVPITQGYSAAQVGFVAAATASAATSGVAATVVDLGASVTFTAIPGHTYKTTAYSGRIDQATAVGRFQLIIADAANTSLRSAQQSIPAAQFAAVSNQLVETGLSGSQTRKVRGTVDAGSATVQAGTFVLVEDITQVQPYDQPLIESGSYTPTLTSMVVGSGGSNVADYTFVGPVGVGSKGMLSLQGRVSFGSSGQTFPTSASRIALPPGFNLANPLSVFHVGLVRASISGVYEGVMATEQSNAASLQTMFASTTSATAGFPITMSAPTASFPAAWANLSEIRWNAQLLAVRV